MYLSNRSEFAAALAASGWAGADAPAQPRLKQRSYNQFTAFLSRFDCALDLGAEIGAPRWFRGMGLLGCMIALAVFLAPPGAPLATPPTLLDGKGADALRQTATGALGFGGDSGSSSPFAASVRRLAAVAEAPRINVTISLAGGDAVAAALIRAGAGVADATRAQALFAAATPLADLAAGTPLNLTLGPRPDLGMARPLENASLRARIDLALSLTRTAQGLTLRQRDIPVDATPLRITGRVGNSVFVSALAGGAPAPAVQQYLAAINGHFGLDNLQPTDDYDLILDYRRSRDGVAQPGGLLYAGVSRNGRPLAQLVRGPSDFLDANATPVPQRATLSLPVANARLTSPYGMRFHPILGFTRMHAGIDLAVPWGTPIHAVADGIVTYAGVHGGHGNFVRLAHAGGMGTGYGHMSRIAVTDGARVSAGQVIGYVGATGLATGPHLHYEVYEGGHTVNPLSVRFGFTTGADAGLTKATLAHMRARLARLLLVKPNAALVPLRF